MALAVTRAESLLAFVPALAAVAAIGAVLVVWLTDAILPMPMRLGWAALVIGCAWLSQSHAARFTIAGGLEWLSGPRRWLIVGWTAMTATLWIALPAHALSVADGAASGGLIGMILMIAGAGLLLFGLPAAAIGWSAIIAAGAAAALLTADHVALVPLLAVLAIEVVMVASQSSRIRHRAEAAIRDGFDVRQRADIAAHRLAAFEARAHDWLWQTDARGALVEASPRLATLLRRPMRELTGTFLPALFGQEGGLAGALAAEKAFDGLLITIPGPGDERTVSLTGEPMFDEQGRFVGFQGIGADITRLTRMQAQVQQIAGIDTLTGLPSRMQLQTMLGEVLATGQPCALMIAGLDRFKPVNDSLGHATGDEVLKQVGQRLAAGVGNLGKVGRLSGDEFGIIVIDAASRKAVTELAERLIGRMAEPVVAGDHRVRIGATIGCAFGPVDGQTADMLVHHADVALQSAKRNDRGTVRLFDHEMQRAIEERLRLEQDLRLALSSDQLRLFYQPVIDARTQRIAGFEALLRWQHPARGFISPAEFIPIAEETGLIVPIGEWVLRTACRDAATWPEGVGIAVNLSPIQMLSPHLPGVVAEALAKSRLQPGRLELEVTESVFLGDSNEALTMLRRLRAFGIGIALDDFGTGYSSLGYLNKAIFHKLKIDGSFVRDAGKKPETVAIIRAIVSLAENFGMAVTAECIETPEDFARMRELGCGLMQGYLFGRPLPYENAVELVGLRGDDRRRIAV